MSTRLDAKMRQGKDHLVVCRGRPGARLVDAKLAIQSARWGIFTVMNLRQGFRDFDKLNIGEGPFTAVDAAKAAEITVVTLHQWRHEGILPPSGGQVVSAGRTGLSPVYTRDDLRIAGVAGALTRAGLGRQEVKAATGLLRDLLKPVCEVAKA